MREQGPDFPFHLKQLENWTQHMKQQLLDTEQQAMEDCDFWDKKVNPTIISLLPGSNFQATVQGRGRKSNRFHSVENTEIRLKFQWSVT